MCRDMCPFEWHCLCRATGAGNQISIQETNRAPRPFSFSLRDYVFGLSVSLQVSSSLDTSGHGIQPVTKAAFYTKLNLPEVACIKGVDKFTCKISSVQ